MSSPRRRVQRPDVSSPRRRVRQSDVVPAQARPTSRRRPRVRGDPYAAADRSGRCGNGLCELLTTVVMGPRLRGDDGRVGGLSESNFKQPDRHTPRRRGIQYAAASRFDHQRLASRSVTNVCGILDRPVKPGDDSTETHLRIPAARSARVVRIFSPPKSEGAGKTGCALHPRSRVPNNKQKKRTRAYRFSGNTPAFPAQWCYGLYVLCPATGLSCHRRQLRSSSVRGLDPSVGGPAPHDFAVRFRRSRQ